MYVPVSKIACYLPCERRKMPNHDKEGKIFLQLWHVGRMSHPDFHIGVRLNPSLHGAFGMTLDEETIATFDYIVNKLNDYNLAYVHLSEPFTDVTNVPYAEPNIARRYRPKYNGPLIINNNFDQEKGNKVIEEGLADLVAFGKLFISNPDLPKRFELNAKLARWDEQTFYSLGEKGYTDYPMLTQK